MDRRDRVNPGRTGDGTQHSGARVIDLRGQYYQVRPKHWCAKSHPQGSRGDRSGVSRRCSGSVPITVTHRPNVHYSVLRKVVSGGVARGLAAGRSDVRRHAEAMTSVSVRTFRTFMPNSSSTRVPGGTPSHFRRHCQAPHRGRKQKSPPKRGSPRPVLKLQLPYSRPSTTESAFSNFLGPPRRTAKFDVAGSRIEDTLMSRNSAANAAPTQRRATSDSVASPQDRRPIP